MEPGQEDRMGLHTGSFGLHAAGPCKKTGWRDSAGVAHADLAFRERTATNVSCADAIERVAEADTDIAHAHAFTEQRCAAIANSCWCRGQTANLQTPRFGERWFGTSGSDLSGVDDNLGRRSPQEPLRSCGVFNRRAR